MGRFFNRLYETCLIAGGIGLLFMLIGVLFYKPIADFGFGCLAIGICAAVTKIMIKGSRD